MEVTLGKTEKGEPIIHKVFINELVKDAIVELSEYTAELRKESGLKELFLCKSAKKKNAINVYSLEHWNDQKLSPFINKYDIRDNKGELYPLTSHQFRARCLKFWLTKKRKGGMKTKITALQMLCMQAKVHAFVSCQMKNQPRELCRRRVQVWKMYICIWYRDIVNKNYKTPYLWALDC